MSDISANILGIDRLRINLDGPGIVTLIGMYKCPLECEYCINNPISIYSKYTIEELFNEIKVDSLYFEYIEGGICFGGHEPLLQQEFIIEFIKYVKSQDLKWNFGMETSFNFKINSELLELLDYIIVDIKDMNPKIYEKYTGISNILVIDNLKKLLNKNVKIRIPLIDGFNNESDIEYSKIKLKELGYKDSQFDVFKYKTSN